MNNDVTFVRDRLEITNLLHSYAHHADSGDITAFLGLFAEDAVVDIGVPGVRDKATLTLMMRDRPPRDPEVQNRHVMSNLVFRGQSAQSASGTLYFTLMSSSAGKVTPLATGRYTFTVGRVDGSWRIREWHAAVDAAPRDRAGEGSR